MARWCRRCGRQKELHPRNRDTGQRSCLLKSVVSETRGGTERLVLRPDAEAYREMAELDVA